MVSLVIVYQLIYLNLRVFHNLPPKILISVTRKDTPILAPTSGVFFCCFFGIIK